MVETILADLAPRPGSEAIFFINGFGGTATSELYVMYNEVHRLVAASGIKVVRSMVGSYVTSLDMVGASVTVSLVDDDALRLWDAPVHTPALRWRM